MTNKVKPFYIRITDDMTPQMVQDAFDKCVDAGSVPDESCTDTKTKHEYKKSYDPSLYLYFGSDDTGMTYMDIDLQYFTKAQEITLDQLDGWLGIAGGSPKQDEWKNGDECVISAKSKSKWFVVGVSPVTETSTVCVSNTGELKSFHTQHLKKPETPEQKAERERLEAIDVMIEDFLSQPQRRDIESAVKRVCSTLYDAGYRKQ